MSLGSVSLTLSSSSRKVFLIAGKVDLLPCCSLSRPVHHTICLITPVSCHASKVRLYGGWTASHSIMNSKHIACCTIPGLMQKEVQDSAAVTDCISHSRGLASLSCCRIAVERLPCSGSATCMLEDIHELAHLHLGAQPESRPAHVHMCG